MHRLEEKARRAEKRRQWWRHDRRLSNFESFEPDDKWNRHRGGSGKRHAPTGAKPTRVRVALAKLFITPRRQAATFVLATCSF